MKSHIVSLLGAIALLASSATMAASNSGCTINALNGSTVNGATLWGEVPMGAGQHSATDCDVDQFAWNNFLNLVANDASGNPRFMSLAPWHDAMPIAGKPVWSGKYAPLQAAQMQKNMNHLQAGDDFYLLDVNGKTVTYDIRVNADFVNYIAENGMYTTQAINKAASAFTADPYKGGIWLPPTAAAPKNSALEIKTAWRNYGGRQGDCPAATMHCEKDSSGNWWGLIGMHLVQKTSLHGEMIWASFEHVANAPDCVAGGSNPIQNKTQWNLFNYASYKKAGGDGANCTYPQNGIGNTQCLTDPNPSGSKWVPVNVCRTDQLPLMTAAMCSTATDNLQIASCLNNSVLANLPRSLPGKWKNYRLIGAEYGEWGSAGTGAPMVGCWNFFDGNPNPPSTVGTLGLSCNGKPNPDPTGENTVGLQGTTHLANTTMETWMQKNIQLKTKTLSWMLVQQDCLSCHQPTTLSFQGDMSHLFGRAQQIGDVEAGPIFSQGQAQQTCPAVCKKAGGKWNGQWTTTVPGQMSVCGCVVDN